MEAIHPAGDESAEVRLSHVVTEGLNPIKLEPLDERPLVSVLIVNYNYASYVGAAIESVLEQTYTNLEVVVCDDGSYDSSCKVIEAFASRDSRVSLVRLPENQGMAAATNAAYAASSGQIICLLDSDDLFYPLKIQQVVRQFQIEPQVGLIIHALMIVDGKTGRPVQQLPFLTRFERGWIADRLVRRGGRWRDMPTSALCFRREVAELVFPIPEPAFRRAADGFIFTLLPLLTEVSAIDEVLAAYRVHGMNDHAAFNLTLKTVRAEKTFGELQIGYVNRTLSESLKLNDILRLERNLGYQQRVLLLSLLEGAPLRKVIPEYLRVSRMLLADDLYSALQKVLGIVIFTVGVLLPARLRAAWFGSTLGFSCRKQRIKRLLSRVANFRL